MGQANTVPRRINRAEGAAGQVILSGGPGAIETWGAPAPAAHVHAAGDVTSGQFPLARMPRSAAGNFLEGNGAADPIWNALIAGDIPNLATAKITSGQFPLARMPRGTLGHVITGQGAADPIYAAVAGATQEFFVNCFFGSGGATEEQFWGGVGRQYLLNLAAEVIDTSFRIPHDFSNLVAAEIIWVGGGLAGTVDWTVTTNFGADTAAFNEHTDNVTADALDTNNNTFNVLDISAAFTGLAAGDNVLLGLKLDARSDDGMMAVLYLRFRYS